MIANPALTAQLIHERQRDLMAQAQQRRLIAQAGLPGRSWRRAGQVRPQWHRVLLRAIRPALPGKA